MTDKVKTILLKARDMLKESGGESGAALEARTLLESVLNMTKEELLKNPDLLLTEDEVREFERLIKRRATKEPVSKIVGKKEFWSLDFETNAYTLDPRPDSETLIEAVLEQFEDKRKELRILDLGTGTGCLLLSLLSEYPNASGLGVDISEETLKIAKNNSRNLSLYNRVEFLVSNWGEKVSESFDIVISNPPYIKSGDIKTLDKEVSKFDPKTALDGGDDGLHCYRAIANQMKKLLKSNGKAFFEIGEGQHHDVDLIMSDMSIIDQKKDLAGITRCLVFKA